MSDTQLVQGLQGRDQVERRRRALWQRSAFVVGVWYLVIGLWVVIGQLNQILIDMHPPGAVSGGFTELTSPFLGGDDAKELVQSWDSWDSLREAAHDERALIAKDIGGATEDEKVIRPVETHPLHVAYFYAAVDALFAPALAYGLWLVLRRRRQQFVPPPGDEPPINNSPFTDMQVIATRRVLRATPGLLVIAVLSDWGEGAFALLKIGSGWPHWPVRITAMTKIGSLMFVVLALAVGAVVARRKRLIPDQPSVFQTLMAVRVQLAACLLLVTTLTLLPGSVSPQVLDAVRIWDRKPIHGLAAALGAIVVTAVFASSAPVQLRRDLEREGGVLTAWRTAAIFIVGLLIAAVGALWLNGGAVTAVGVAMSVWAVLSIPLIGTAAEPRGYRESWITLGTVSAAVPFALWVAIARARIEPTAQLQGRMMFLLGVSALAAILVWGCLHHAAKLSNRVSDRDRGIRRPTRFRRVSLVVNGAGAMLALLGVLVVFDVARSHGGDKSGGAVIDAWGGIAVVAAAAASVLGLAVVTGRLTMHPPRGVPAVLGVRRAPVLSALVVLVLVVSTSNAKPAFHSARTLPDDPSEKTLPRTGMQLENAFDTFLAGQSGERPIIVVATAGGGARAAYWTTIVLDCLFGEPKTPGSEGVSSVSDGLCGDLGLDFQRDLFAVSGISGGSVGAAMYAAAAWSGFVHPSGQPYRPEEAWENDFLAPVISNYLFVDAPNALADIGQLPDRAEAMERAWEDIQPILERGLFETQLGGRGGTPRFPILLMNGATLDGGCRFNVSVLDLGAADPLGQRSDSSGAGLESSCRSLAPYGVPGLAATSPTVPVGGGPSSAAMTSTLSPGPSGAGVLEATLDLADHLCDTTDVRLSTAALLSARFPFVLSSGALERCGVGGFSFDVDGGLLDSSGASPAEAVVAHLRHRLSSRPWVDGSAPPCRRVVVVQIDNGYDDEAPPAIESRPGEIRGLASGWFGAIGSRADEERQGLAELASELDTCGAQRGVAPYVRLTTRAHAGARAPLGWALSDDAKNDLDSQLHSVENRCALAALASLVDASVDKNDVRCVAGVLRDGEGRLLPGRDVCLIPGQVPTSVRCNTNGDRDLPRAVRSRTDSVGAFRFQLSASELKDDRFTLSIGDGADRQQFKPGRSSTDLLGPGALTIVDLFSDSSGAVVVAGRERDRGGGAPWAFMLWMLVTVAVAAKVLTRPSGPLDRGPGGAPLPRMPSPGDEPEGAAVRPQPEPRSSSPRGLPDDRPAIWAHQGGALEGPANTVWAMQQATAGTDIAGQPADGLEVDVRLSADGVPVVIHDRTVDRTTDGTGDVALMPHDELRQLNASARFSLPDGEQPPLVLRIPSLDEVLETFADWPFIIEVKHPSAVPAVVWAVNQRPPGSITYLTSFQQATCREILAYSTSERPLLVAPGWSASLWLVLRAKIGRLPNTSYAALHRPPRILRIRLVTPKVVRRSKDSNIRVDVWTINDTGRLSELMDFPREERVDGVMTDAPRLLGGFLRRLGGS